MPKATITISPHLKKALADHDENVAPSAAEISHCFASKPKLPRDITNAFARQGSPFKDLRARQRPDDNGWRIAASRK